MGKKKEEVVVDVIIEGATKEAETPVDDPKVIEVFDPRMAELTAMVKSTQHITVTDLEDPAQIEIVKRKRIEFKNTRVKIEKLGFAAREESNRYSKAVIAYENKLVGVIEPEEKRLAAIEEEAKLLAIRKERIEKLPVRKERIEAAGLSFFHDKTDDEMLELDSNGFEAYFNELGARKVEYDADQEEMKRAEAQKELDAENARIKAEQDAKEKELADKEAKLEADRKAMEHEKELEQAKKDTEARMKKEQEERDADLAREKKEEDERIAREKKEADAKLAKQKKYQEFLKSVGMTKDNVAEFHKIETDLEIVIYKKVGSFTK